MSAHPAEILALLERGDWDAAHRAVQVRSDTVSCLIHAYLHRLEGDLSNAHYWYTRAGESFPANNLVQELARLQALAERER